MSSAEDEVEEKEEYLEEKYSASNNDPYGEYWVYYRTCSRTLYIS